MRCCVCACVGVSLCVCMCCCRGSRKSSLIAPISCPIGARTEQLYEVWVHKLASREYADELVVLAVALELSIRIVVIPYTPEFALEHWKILTYGPTAAAQDASRTIYLGNNDVHFVIFNKSMRLPRLCQAIDARSHDTSIQSATSSRPASGSQTDHVLSTSGSQTDYVRYRDALARALPGYGRTYPLCI